MSAETEHSRQREPSDASLQAIPQLPDDAWEEAVRGRHAARAKWAPGLVRIDQDLLELFPTEQAVNEALRAIALILRRVETSRR